MALESASFINDLVSANPPGSDTLAQADDHIRLIKGVLKSTFPNINQAISSTPLQLNTYLVPQGAILMWSGSTASIPSGWALCNGSTQAKADGTGNVTLPDLRDRFIVGAGSTYAVGATDGATSNTPVITMTNASVTLTANQIPAHTHTATVTDPGHSHTMNDPGHTHSYIAGGSATGIVQGGSTQAVNISSPVSGSTSGTSTTGLSLNSNTTSITVSNANTGGGQGHTHTNTATCSSVPTLPPYYALCFIYKL